MSDLLPIESASALDHLIADTGAAILDIPAPIDRLKNPAEIPEHLLAYLAWELSVDIWREEWPVEVKRDVVRRAIEMHRLKGTLEGIRQHVALTGSEVVHALLPPDTFFPDPGLTMAEREAYLARYPQVRMYHFRNKGRANYGAFFGRGYGLSKLFADRFFPVQMGAGARIGVATYIFDPRTGIETPATRIVREDILNEEVGTTIEQVVVPGGASLFLFSGGRPLRKAFLSDRGIDQRTYTVRLDREYITREERLHINTAVPGLKPIDINPTRKNIGGVRQFGSLFAVESRFGHEYLAPKKVFLPASKAALQIFDVIYLHDPAIATAVRGSRSFAGYVRLGMPAFHAKLTVEVESKRPRKAFSRFVAGYLVATDKTNVDEARKAIATSKAARDTVWMSLKTFRPLEARDAPLVGEGRRVGEWIKVR